MLSVKRSIRKWNKKVEEFKETRRRADYSCIDEPQAYVICFL